jgi:hypothetical protein
LPRRYRKLRARPTETLLFLNLTSRSRMAKTYYDGLLVTGIEAQA